MVSPCWRRFACSARITPRISAMPSLDSHQSGPSRSIFAAMLRHGQSAVGSTPSQSLSMAWSSAPGPPFRLPLVFAGRGVTFTHDPHSATGMFFETGDTSPQTGHAHRPSLRISNGQFIQHPRKSGRWPLLQPATRGCLKTLRTNNPRNHCTVFQIVALALRQCLERWCQKASSSSNS